MNEYKHTETSLQRVMAAILIFAPLLSFPLAIGKLWRGSVPLFSEVSGVDFAVLALLASGAIAAVLPVLARTMERERMVRIFTAGCGLGCVIVLVQQVRYGLNSVSLLTGAGCFLVPVAGFLFAKELRRLLPVFLLTLFTVSAAVTLREWSLGTFAVGLAGNWNWNWTLLVVSAPALVFFLPVSRWRLPLGAILAFAVAAGQFLFCGDYASRGTLMSCLAAAVWIALAGYFHRRPKLRTPFAVAAILLILAAGSVAYYGVRSGYFAERLPGENRLMLWQGTTALGEAHWLLGVGPNRFEGEVAPFLPESYYDSDYASDRHPHPHNELLFYWCVFGVAGIVWWLLIIWAGVRGAVRRRRGDELVLLVIWAWSVLFLHGQVDVLLQTPLAGGLFLLLTGILLGVGVPCVRPAPAGRFRYGAALGLSVIAVLLFFLNLSGGWHCRSGKLALLDGEPETAREELKRSIRIRPTAENLYTLAAVELFDFRNPGGAAEALRRVRDDLRLSSYSHSAGRMARALAAGGKPAEALPFFEEEQKNFPRSAVNLILWQSVLRQLGREEEASGLLAAWQELLKRKGVRPEEFHHLMRNQMLDDSPLELRLFLREVRK